MNSRELHAKAMSIKKMRKIATVAGMSAALCAGTVSAASAANAETVPDAGPAVKPAAAQTVTAGKVTAQFRGARTYYGENFEVHAFNFESGTLCRNLPPGSRNKLSSLKTNRGVVIQLYDKPNCGGAKSTWLSGEWKKLSERGWNNRADSVTVLES